MLIGGMGKERFGLLTIIWMGVGYFSLFDMGLGRALTKLVSERIGSGREADMGPLIWSALWLILGLGSIGAVILFNVAEPLIRHVLNVEEGMEQEAITAFRVLAAGIPFVIVTAALSGILESHQRFGTIMAIRIPLGTLTFLGPLFTMQFSPSLVWATLAMLAARVMASLVYFLVATRCRKELSHPVLPQRNYMKPLFQFGGWLSVTNIVGPFLVYFDRFLLGAIMTMTAVTYYVTPYEVMSKLQLVSAAVMGVLFPAMSATYAADRSRLVYLYERTTRVLVVLMVPVTCVLFLFAPEGLNVWLGQDFVQQSTPVVQWLALGWLINVMAQAPFTILQSCGRPDLVAKTHLAELIPYILLLWVMTTNFGIAGTAATWFLRVLVDTIILNMIAQRVIPELHGVIRRTYVELLAVLAAAVVLWNITSLPGRGIALIIVACLIAVPAWNLGRNFFTYGSVNHTDQTV